MLYHVSSIPGIKVLEPRVSTHGKAYVYAIDNLATGFYSEYIMMILIF